MQELHSLLHSLTSGEWQSLQVFLTAFTSRNADNLKYIRLAKMLMEANEPPTPEACCLKIYGKEKDPGFKMLKSRLKEKVFDFLVTDISTDKKQELDKMDFAAIKIKKRSILFHQLYYSKKRLPLVYGVLDEIINLSKEYEYYSATVEHLKWKKNLLSWKTGEKEFEKINQEMEYYSECNSMLNKAQHWYYKLMMHSEHSGKPNHEKILFFLKEKTVKLKGYHEKIKSPLVKYYLKSLELAFFHQCENYLQAKNICLELLHIVRNNKSVYRRERISIIYDHLSRCEYYLRHFKKAVEYAREAQKNFTAGSANYCVALEQEFYAMFALKKYNEVLEIANKMLTSATKKELGDFRHAKYNFLLANVLFKLCKYKEVISILSKGLEISKDKAGWEIGIRVLTIMAYIEMQKPDEAAISIERLRKFIAFTDKKTPVSLRDKTILQLLQHMEKDGHPLCSLPLKGRHSLPCEEVPIAIGREGVENLLSKLGEWEPFTHEVIPFHKWVEGKVQNTSP